MKTAFLYLSTSWSAKVSGARPQFCCGNPDTFADQDVLRCTFVGAYDNTEWHRSTRDLKDRVMHLKQGSFLLCRQYFSIWFISDELYAACSMPNGRQPSIQQMSNSIRYQTKRPSEFPPAKSTCGLSARSEEPKGCINLWKLNFQKSKHVFVMSTEGSAQVLT